MPNDDPRQETAANDRSAPDGAAAHRRLSRAEGSVGPGSGTPYTRRRRTRIAATSRKESTTRRTPRHPSERYRHYRQGRGKRSRASTARPVSGASAQPGSLAAAFDRAEQEQQLVQNTPRHRLRRITRKRWFWPAVGIPGILFLVLAVVLSPVLYSAFFAYRDVQVGSVDHIQSAFVPQLNQQGTPELVAAPTESSSSFNWSGQERITILLLGVDKSVNGASRTDTIILVNIDPRGKTASMLSIPRDLKVVIPGYGIDKINAAFALGDFNKVQGGGAGLTINGFINMVDTVGGITVDVPYPIKDDTYPAENFSYQRIYFPAGWQHMDGEEALKYARTRHQDGDSRRAARQQQVLLSLRDQAVNLDLIPQLPTLIEQFGDSVRTDIAITDAVKLARLGTSIPRHQITQVSLLPALYDDQEPGGPYYLSADWDAVGNLLTEFTGTSIRPPGAALVNPDYGLPILIENGTNNEGLAGRVGDFLEANGFWNIEVATAKDDGDHDKTTIRDRENNLGTSALITNLIGVGADTIALGDDGSQIGDGTGTNSGNGGNYAIVITLGDDAPDPATDQWNLQDYQRESGNDGAFEGELPATEGE
jgi:anionic cell wall polymer biosynthesis LytR-Cps2A-Psr (LCP) family protein